MRVPLLNFEGGPGVPLLNFEGGPGVPLLNFMGFPVPLLNFEGGPGVLVPLLHRANKSAYDVQIIHYIFQKVIRVYLAHLPKFAKLLLALHFNLNL